MGPLNGHSRQITLSMQPHDLPYQYGHVESKPNGLGHPTLFEKPQFFSD